MGKTQVVYCICCKKYGQVALSKVRGKILSCPFRHKKIKLVSDDSIQATSPLSENALVYKTGGKFSVL